MAFEAEVIEQVGGGQRGEPGALEESWYFSNLSLSRDLKPFLCYSPLLSTDKSNESFQGGMFLYV